MTESFSPSMAARRHCGKPLKPFSGIGSDERDAVLRFFDGADCFPAFTAAPGQASSAGRKSAPFEAAWCERFSTRHAVSVNSPSGLHCRHGGCRHRSGG